MDLEDQYAQLETDKRALEDELAGGNTEFAVVAQQMNDYVLSLEQIHASEAFDSCLGNQLCNLDFRTCMTGYTGDNYETHYGTCLTDSETHGGAAVAMLAIFADEPTWDDYEPDPALGVDPADQHTDKIRAYFQISAPLGGKTFFLVNKDGVEVPTPTIGWVNG